MSLQPMSQIFDAPESGKITHCARMKLGNQGTTLAVLFCFVSMILSTIFSGLVIVKLMAHEKPKHIESLDDLRARTSVRIIMIPKSYVDDIFNSSEKQDLRSRIDFMTISVTNESSLEEALDKILDGGHVLIDDRSNFERYLRAFKARKMEQFHLSNPINFTPGAWILPKQLELSKKESIILNLQRHIMLGESLTLTNSNTQNPYIFG